MTPTATVVMATVAAITGLVGAAVLMVPPKSEAGMYRRRIAGTMLVALGLILIGFVWAMGNWGTGA